MALKGKWLWIIIVVVVVAALAYWWYDTSSSSGTGTPQQAAAVINSVSTTAASSGTSAGPQNPTTAQSIALIDVQLKANPADLMTLSQAPSVTVENTLIGHDITVVDLMNTVGTSFQASVAAALPAKQVALKAALTSLNSNVAVALSDVMSAKQIVSALPTSVSAPTNVAHLNMAFAKLNAAETALLAARANIQVLVQGTM